MTLYGPFTDRQDLNQPGSFFYWFHSEMTLHHETKLRIPGFLLSGYSLRLSERNVFLEVFYTSETKQEEGGALDPAAERLTRIRSPETPQTKSVLLKRWRRKSSAVSLHLNHMMTLIQPHAL